MFKTIQSASLFAAMLLVLSACGANGADQRLVGLLKKGPAGIEQFNHWRRLNPAEEVNLVGADLRDVNLQSANLRLADLRNAKLQGAVFGLNYADEAKKAKECRDRFDALIKRSNSVSQEASLHMSRTTECDNGFGILANVRKKAADLSGADLQGAVLDGADFTGAKGCDEALNAPPDFEARCANP